MLNVEFGKEIEVFAFQDQLTAESGFTGDLLQCFKIGEQPVETVAMMFVADLVFHFAVIAERIHIHPVRPIFFLEEVFNIWRIDQDLSAIIQQLFQMKKKLF